MAAEQLDRTKAPNVTELTGMQLPPLSRYTLANGVEIALLDAGKEPVTRVTVLTPGGKLDIDEPAAFPILTSVISEGTRRNSGTHIAEAMEYNGAWSSYSAGRHYSVSTLHTLNDRASKVIPLFVEVLTEPLLSATDVDTQRCKQAADVELQRKKVSYIASEVLNQEVYGMGNPGAKILTGKDFLDVTPQDVRALYKKAFLGAPPVIYLAGHVTDEILSLVEKYFGAVNYNTSEGLAQKIIPAEFKLKGEKRIVDVPDSLQTAIKIAIPTISRQNSDYEQMRLATVALGGYFGSRLMQKIREEKGYTYGITASPVPRLEGTFVKIECQTDNRYVDLVLEETEREIYRLATEPITHQELTGIRRLILSTLASVLDSPFAMVDYHLHLDSLGIHTDCYRQQVESALAMTPQTIIEAASRYLLGTPRLIALAGATTNSLSKSL